VARHGDDACKVAYKGCPTRGGCGTQCPCQLEPKNAMVVDLEGIVKGHTNELVGGSRAPMVQHVSCPLSQHEWLVSVGGSQTQVVVARACEGPQRGIPGNSLTSPDGMALRKRESQVGGMVVILQCR
jgi:hypothetical protein